MDELGNLQQRQLKVHNYGEVIERAIWKATKSKKPNNSPYPFGMCTADSCCKNPLPFMYCAFTNLIGKDSDTAEDNLKEFDCLYSGYLGCSLSDLFDEGEGFVEKMISDFRALCR